MKAAIEKLWRKLWSREVISYLIFGVLTTIVNIVVYQVMYHKLSMENLTANAAAWLVAVIFAYITNSRIVFLTRPSGIKEEFRQLAAFLGARLFSLGVDELGMWIMVDVMELDSLLSKISMNVIVIIINYAFSKFFIFKGSGGKKKQ